MKAIVDCNSFYCSCERVFKPHLDHKPVVVLSNNDGCIISRTDEAKALGVGMAGPYFKAKDVIEQNGVAVFSSNYNLYGDLSRRVMETLIELVGENNVEVYSVDEAFLDLDQLCKKNYYDVALSIRTTVAKLANRFSKKNKESTNCIAVLDTKERIIGALKQTKVEGLWGVGKKFAEKLYGFEINTA